jgi:hypothetical protein
MMATMICSVRFILGPLDVADCELMLCAEEFLCEMPCAPALALICMGQV